MRGFGGGGNGGGAAGMGGKKITADQAKEFMQQKVVKVGDSDKEIWRLLTDVPKLNKVLAIVFAIINVILPGFGTMFAACFTNDPEVSKAQIAIGLIQFLTSAFIIGWIASIYWGYLLVMKAIQDDNPQYSRQPNYAPPPGQGQFMV